METKLSYEREDEPTREEKLYRQWVAARVSLTNLKDRSRAGDEAAREILQTSGAERQAEIDALEAEGVQMILDDLKKKQA